MDLNTFVGVESLFHSGICDPWGTYLAGELADAFIYSDQIRYPLPVPDQTITEPSSDLVPAIVTKLFSRDTRLAKPIVYSTAERLVAEQNYVRQALVEFVKWAKRQQPTFRKWCDCHEQQNWIVNLAKAEIAHKYTFSIDALERWKSVSTISNSLQVSPSAFVYAFDSVLRYPRYGQMTEKGEYYLNHPLRDSVDLPTMAHQQAPPPNVPLSFKNAVSAAAHKLTLDEYCVLLHSLRGAVRDRRIHQAKPGDFDRNIVREIMGNAGLPARLRGSKVRLQLFGSAVTIAGSIGSIAPRLSLVGGLMTMAGTIWDSVVVPRSISKIRWLRWALEWPEEKNAVRIERKDR